MGRIRRSRHFRIDVKSAEVVRFLGYGARQPPAQVNRLLEEIRATAPQLLTPARAYRVLAGAELAPSRLLCTVDTAALCLVTIGGALEAQVERHKQQGDLGRALLLDAYGSAAAEAAADAAEILIRRSVARSGLRCSRRFSPGYGDWDIAEQPWIIAALRGEELGVRLTSGVMMAPRKSITFAVTIGTNPPQLRAADRCAGCDLSRCPYRRVAPGEHPEETLSWKHPIDPLPTSCPRRPSNA